MMRWWCVFFVVLALAAGCRREDVRTVTLDLPGLTEQNAAKVREAFRLDHGRVCEGVELDSFVFDFTNRTLTLRYDSMKTAHTNLRMLIQAKGVEVAFPSNATGRAGH